MEGIGLAVKVDEEKKACGRDSRFLSPRLCHNTRGSKPEARLLSPSKSPSLGDWLTGWIEKAFHSIFSL